VRGGLLGAVCFGQSFPFGKPCLEDRKDELYGEERLRLGRIITQTI